MTYVMRRGARRLQNEHMELPRSAANRLVHAKHRALARAHEAVAEAEQGETVRLELGVAARPVLQDLLEEGALDRAVPLLERDGQHASIVIMPRGKRGPMTIAELLEHDHVRLDGVLDMMRDLLRIDPA